MNRLQVAFCDDDAAFRTYMAAAVTAAFQEQGVLSGSFEAASALELSAAVGHMTFDLIFLDIDMPGMDGIRFGEQLRSQGCRSDIIYVSNMDDKVYEIFRVHPWSFIRKSRFADELPALIEEYVFDLRGRGNAIVLPGTETEAIAVDPQEIIYLEAVGKTQNLFQINQTAPISIRASMHELENRLSPFGFIRIHKGFLVNYRYIHKITSRSVMLDTGDDLPIGRDRLKSARESYLALMKWKGLNRSP